MRNRQLRTVELTGDVDVERSCPIGWIDFFAARGRTGDPGVVDEHIETAQRAQRFLEETRDGGAIGDVANAAGQGRIGRGKRVERAFIDIAHVHTGALTDECARSRESNAARARGDEDASIVQLEVHGKGPECRAARRAPLPIAYPRSEPLPNG